MGVKPYYEDPKSGIVIYCGDCREILPTLPKVDLVLTDPPYGISYNPKRTYTGNKKWVFRKPLPAVFGDEEEFNPDEILQTGCRSILWGANHYAARLPCSGAWLVWDKKCSGTLARGFTASDAELAWTNLDGCLVRLLPLMWHGLVRQTEVGQHYHPTQKPIRLMAWCMSFAPDAKTILDPFMGSGTTLRAAKDLGRKAIGIEIEERYCEIAARRLAQEVLSL